MKHEALFYQKESSRVLCFLCPHYCALTEGKRGNCGVRQNIDGKLYSLNYGLISALHIDPIEKKPLSCFYPGSSILSIGSVGCNMHCSFCQNCDISQTNETFIYGQEYSVEDIVLQTLNTGTLGLAFTYNEPTVYYEFMYDVAERVHKAGKKCVVVSNGFINNEPLQKLLPYVDAFNIDLKAFTESFYNNVSYATLEPVKETLQRIVKSGTHVEVTYLVVTDLNDNETEFEAMCLWISQILGKEIPLHISRYFPRYKLGNDATDMSILLRFQDIACKYLENIYVGNV